MPARKPEKEYFKNAKTWKQVSTNVPPEKHKALKSRVTTEYTMSHVIRDLIAESDVMRGGWPQPIWSVELAKELATLRAEITELRKGMSALSEAAATSAVEEEAPIAPAVEPEQEPESPPPDEPVKPKLWLLVGRLLGVARKTA